MINPNNAEQKPRYRVMAFYLTPPKGSISLQKLTKFAAIRLQFLMKIVDTDGDVMKLHDLVMDEQTVDGSECLIEGSTKDIISHFVLRLACYKNPEMASFLINAETLLFDWRFSCMTEDELYKLFKSLDPYLIFSQNNNDMANYDRYMLHNSDAFAEMSNIIETFQHIKEPCGRWRNVVKKYLSGEREESFDVPFLNVLSLVRRRKAILRKGIAAVGYCHLRTVVTEMFRRLMYLGTVKSRLKLREEDERILNLTSMLQCSLKHWYFKKPVYCNPVPVSHGDVNNLAVYFPPCMSHALQLLRTKHRLGHHTRLQLTLFLKEVGLPIHEALMLWREEYTKTQQGQGHRCNHDWQHNERRYTYNIRHLYGLEGSRTNYRGHSCQYLQEEFRGHQEEGGCPFSHFDVENIEDFLKTSSFRGDPRIIVDAAVNGKPSSACRLLLQEKMKNHSTKDHSSLRSLIITEKSSLAKNSYGTDDKEVKFSAIKLNLHEKGPARRHTKVVNDIEIVIDGKQISKPIDYFVSYKNFVERLKN